MLKLIYSLSITIPNSAGPRFILFQTTPLNNFSIRLATNVRYSIHVLLRVIALYFVSIYLGEQYLKLLGMRSLSCVTASTCDRWYPVQCTCKAFIEHDHIITGNCPPAEEKTLCNYPVLQCLNCTAENGCID